MLVRMRTAIGGFRNGSEWPPVGGTLDVPDHEAVDLIANGYAEEATDAADTADHDNHPAKDGDEGSDEDLDAEAARDSLEAFADVDTEAPAEPEAEPKKPAKSRARKV